MKIGIVDIDTSHPAAWIPLEREMGHEIVGLFDGGDIHSIDYTRNFAEKFEIPRIYSSLKEMAEEMDCAILHGCNWDTHIEKARPFVESGKSVLIDKPFAGNLTDLQQILDWVSQGARITGGSSLRFCDEVKAWLQRPERGEPHTAFAGCGVDEFNYGVHAYSLLIEAMGCGVQRVHHLGKGVQRRIQLEWNDGRMGFLCIGKQEKWLPFHLTVVTDQSVVHLEPNPQNLYRALLKATLPYLARQTDIPPVPLESLVEAEKVALAAQQSWLTGNRKVFTSDVEDSGGYDGTSFALSYRKAIYGK